MTKLSYPGVDNLNGRQRGYKQAGKRLLPRDAYDAYEIGYMKLHGLKELQRHRIAESKAHGPSPFEGDFDPFDSALRKLRALSGRKRKLAENAAYGDGDTKGLPRSIRRVVDAMGQATAIQRAIDYDQKMLSNAY